MASEDVAPAAPTMNSWVNKSAGVFTGAVNQRTQTRAGSDVAPSQMKRRGSTWTLGWLVSASLARYLTSKRAPRS